MITYPNLYSLKYFVDAVELGSVSAAALKNRVTHSAVSRAISQLEIDLGIELLIHQKRNFQVTEAGRDLARKAIPLLENAGKFQKSRHSGEAQESFEFSIGISRSLGSVYLPSLIEKIKKQIPNLQVKIKYGTSSEITAWVASEQVQLGIAIDPPKMLTLKCDRIAEGQFVLVDSTSGGKDNFENRSFLITEPRAETEKLKKDFGKRFKKALPLSVEVASWDAIAELVDKKIGIGLVPEFIIGLHRYSRLKKIHSPWFQCSYSIFTIILKRKMKSHPLEISLEHLNQIEKVKG